MTENIQMTSSRPYLLQALMDWITDNHLTPHIIVDANYPETLIPRQFVENGKIVLNISPFAVRDFLLDKEKLSFSARFGGSPMDIYIPIAAVLAIYARENGQGMVFAEDNPPPVPPDPNNDGPSNGDGPSDDADKKPKLTLVK